MHSFKIAPGIAIIEDENSGWWILDENATGKISTGPATELIRLMNNGPADEDRLVAALEDRFSLEEVYYTLIQLEKQGLIVEAGERQESASDLFRAKLLGRKPGEASVFPNPVLEVRILAIGGMNASAESLAELLARSDMLRIERPRDWSTAETGTAPVWLALTPDYLEPELETFGRFAQERKLRWLPVKPVGVSQWFGPLFLPHKTGCLTCLLDRLKGHRRLETEQIRSRGGRTSLRLSVGQTVHSLETAAGLLVVELEKVSVGNASEMAGRVLTLDFQALKLERHPLTQRPQCPQCGTLFSGKRIVTLSKNPLQLQSRRKADYRDGGERICKAVETLERFSHLIDPITGVVARMKPLEDIPSCFGPVIKSTWQVRNGGNTKRGETNARASALGFSTGKGRTDPQARASALGEAIERYCSQHEGYEPHIRASFEELGDAAIPPQDLMGFSERQYRDRKNWRRKGGVLYVPDPYDPNRPIDWTPAWSLTQRRWRLIPSAFAYYSYPDEGGGDICRGCSNGVAAGNCLEEAVMQGFFELVERDAVALWWYHRLSKAALELSSFGSPFAAAVEASMEELGMKLEVLDLTSDLAIPVFCANLFNRHENGRFKTLGLGCHRDPLIALERALSELGQSWRRRDMDQDSLEFQETPLSQEAFLHSDLHQRPKISSDFHWEPCSDFLEEIGQAVRLLSARNLELLVVDLTRPDIGFPVARVIVPGMVHFWPRFGCRRLFEVPKSLGWIAGEVAEQDLNPIPFYL